jgi:hypothetical protein
MTSVSRDFFKYPYLIAQIPIILDNSFNSSHWISSLFSRIIAFALFSASSSKSPSLMIFPFLVENAHSFHDTNPLYAWNN